MSIKLFTILAILSSIGVLAVITGCGRTVSSSQGDLMGVAPSAENMVTDAPADPTGSDDVFDGKTIEKTDKEWKQILTPEQYHILREAGTEIAYTGKYAETHEAGDYYCAACHLKLFSSKTKFESGTGWPSFYEPVNKKNVIEVTDKTLGMERTEVLCARCKGHLGHVFDDGPKPTGLRYCMNSGAMTFEKANKK